MSSSAAVDLTSANYLGLWLGRDRLPDWGNLTTGVPAVLDAGNRSDRVAAALSRLIGPSMAAALAPSTLHACWDVFSVLARDAGVICVDAAAYPIARWAAEHAALRGAQRGLRLRRFAHHSPAALRQVVGQAGGRGPAVVLTDGVCTGCGAVAPIPDYLAAVTGRGGVVVVDDTQGLGVLGTPAAGHLYGVGGGGVLRHLGLTAATGAGSVVVVASMAKAFGVPVAVVASTAEFTRTMRTTGQTRVHCSPPSNAHLAAAEVSLRLNANRGDLLRSVLAERVRQLRDGLIGLDIRPTNGLFPVQSVRAVPSGIALPLLWRRLRRAGVTGVLLGEQCDHLPAITFVVTATHSTDHIDRALSVLAESAELGHRGRRIIPRSDLSDHRQPLPCR